MAVLTNRQQLARKLVDELNKFEDVWVTSPLPLRDGTRLHIQILDRSRNEVVQIIKDLGYDARFVSVLPRITSTWTQAACLYEVDFPGDRQPIIDDRVIPKGEIAEPTKKTDVELEGMRRYLEGKL
jgi:hypothetical protein